MVLVVIVVDDTELLFEDEEFPLVSEEVELDDEEDEETEKLAS